MKSHQLQQNSKKRTLGGFTIVELSITMAFIAALLISIAIVTTNILAIYQKGSAIKAVNSVGRGLIDNFTSAIASAPSLNINSTCLRLGAQPFNAPDSAIERCTTDHAMTGYVYNSYTDNDGKQLYGIFCTGNTSYVWNTAYGFKQGKTIELKYHSNNSPDDITIPAQDITLLSIQDTTRRVCTAALDTTHYASKLGGNYTLDITHYADNPSQVLSLPDPEKNLLANNESKLLLYELTIFPHSINITTGRAFYAGTFILATDRGGVNIMGNGDYCHSTKEGSSSMTNLGSEFNYCAINKFNFAARSAGE